MTRDLSPGPHSRMRSCSLLAALLLTLGSTALAQPTGNPKGTSPPPMEGNSQKQPATAGGVPMPLTPAEAASRPAAGARDASPAGSGADSASGANGSGSKATRATKHSTRKRGTARRSPDAAAPRAQP